MVTVGHMDIDYESIRIVTLHLRSSSFPSSPNKSRCFPKEDKSIQVHEKCNDLQLKSLLAATESKIQVGFTTGSPALKALHWTIQQLNLNCAKE